ncbi:BspA family leucine-rich repeat surface protein [Aliikangiella sp. IMCC44653]
MFIHKHLSSLLALFLLIAITACGGGGGGSTEPPQPILDTTAPVITLNGDANMTLVQGETYQELGASASDDRDGNVNVVITGSVDTAILGDYLVTYSATDAAGNSSSLVRTVTVVLPSDVTAPVISLIGDNPMTLFQNQTYEEPGATATDDRDGNVDVVITGSVDTAILGDYQLTYTATDAAGNSSSLVRTVIVVLPPDVTAPVITLIGDNPMTLFQNEAYQEPGATATDDRDGNVSLVITGSVDTAILGDYQLTYTATDAAGNSSSLVRTVIVVLPPDVTAPVITLIGDNPLTLFQNQAYEEPGATATDDRDGDVDVVITGSVDTSSLGDYEISYTATDEANNSSNTIRTVSVVDGTAPVVTITGPTSLIVILNKTYQELGATASDDIDGELTVGISGTVDTSTVGIYTITYTATDAAGNIGSANRTVSVEAATPFITTWKTDNFGFSDYNQVKIGTRGVGYDYQVDWGDGSSDTNVTGDITHTYSAAGTYIISITGDFPRIFFDKNGYDNEKLLSIEQWGNQPWQSMGNAFFECYNLVGNASDIPNLSQVTDMSFMFNEAEAFNQDISNWDVSAVTDMSYMFFGALAFNQSLSNWDVSAVTDMRYMFNFARAFNQDLSNWDVSAVTNMNHMFYEAYAFNQDISNWDVSAVTDMSHMFYEAYAFNQDISSWDVSAVTDMSYMFYEAEAFNQDISNWDVSAVTDMSYMFYNAEAFNQDISRWDVRAVTDMSYMFYNVEAFNQDISRWDVSAVTNMSYMFRYVRAFNQDLSNWDVSAVTNMSHMFYNANAFNQDLSNWDVSAVTDMSYMFAFAAAFNQYLNNWDVSAVTNMGGIFRRAEAFNQDLSNWDVSSVTNMGIMFSGAEAFNQDLSNWDVSAVTNMRSMFSGAKAFNQYLNNWDVSAVTNMRYMFSETDAFNQALSNWNVSAVTDMSGMFNNAKAFNQALSNWNVSAATDMSFMFYNAKAFNQDLSNWDVSAVTNMMGMFLNASAFNQDLGNWDVSAVTNMSNMFSGAIVFNQDLSSWDVSAVTNMRGMFGRADAFNKDLSSWDVSAVTDMSFMFYEADAFNQALSNWDVSAVTDMSSMFYNAGAFNQDLSNWDVSAVNDMTNMFANVTLSTANYDALLSSWSVQSLQNNVVFNAGNSTYSAFSQGARDTLTGTYSWTVTDGGVEP